MPQCSRCVWSLIVQYYLDYIVVGLQCNCTDDTMCWHTAVLAMLSPHPFTLVVCFSLWYFGWQDKIQVSHTHGTLTAAIRSQKIKLVMLNKATFGIRCLQESQSDFALTIRCSLLPEVRRSALACIQSLVLLIKVVQLHTWLPIDKSAAMNW